MRRNHHWVSCTMVFLFLALAAEGLWALDPPDRSRGVGQKAFRHPDLEISNAFQRPSQLPPQAAAALQQQLAGLGLSDEQGRLDRRGGRWATLLFARPLLPGRGVGNTLSWPTGPPPNDAAYQQAAWNAFNGFLQANAARLRIDLNELARPGRVTVQRGGELVQIHVPRQIDGIPVRGSYLSATINHGNLVLFGAHNWGTINLSMRPELSQEDALAALQTYLDTFTPSDSWGRAEFNIVPMAQGRNIDQVAVGQGYAHRLAWVLKVTFPDDLGRWEALVDARSGEVLSFEDTNHYAEVMGGVYPVTNDGIVPDGVEQPGWPMPFDNVSTSGGTQTTDTGGNLTATGSMTSNLAGEFVRMNDSCGAISLTEVDGIDFGTSGGTDCATPGFGGPGNTHASRTGFYELNKVIEMARGQLPTNSWLQQQLTANMNINQTCNAFWNGTTVNFYRSGGGCSNTGEIAGVFDHEWGHGLDDNDATPGIAGPSGEGIADIYTALRLNDSCIGRNFRSTVCTGFGDPCLTCTGVRDIDYEKHQSGEPHDYTWSNANCGGVVHCVGVVYAEAVWSLWKRELQAAPYNYDDHTAHEIVNRLTFIGAGSTGTWFSGGPPNGGCAGSSGYMNYLAADDDNGDLTDGTPHMTAIYNAFNDQEIACETPTVQDSGCSGTPTTAPVVAVTRTDKSVGLSWGAVTGATGYEVFRTEGVFACNFGKVRLGETTGTTWNDSGLQNGRDYSYVVIPKGGSASCFGPASSCSTGAPAAGPNLDVDVGSAGLAILTGDEDQYLDNCEVGEMMFDVVNTGLGALTNVRIVDVIPSNGEVTLSTAFPSPISPSALAEGETGSGSFSFTTGGLAPGEILTFQVEVIADEMTAPKLTDLTVSSTETDLTFAASQTYSFESDAEGWTTLQGTFNRASAGGGSSGAWYEQSSANLDNQCDQIQSPVMVFSATTTLTLWNNYDIEEFDFFFGWFDRANVGIVDSTNTRMLVSPDGGRLYNAFGANGTCGTNGQDGWADAATSWGSSSWSAAALGSAGLAGQEVRLDIRYGTDAFLNGYGFRFDEVTVTDVSVPGPDAQSNNCSAGCTVDGDCNDGLFCNGVETCNAGTCQAGTLVSCDDGVSCTVDSCNESTGSCDNAPNDAACDNGLFCDGVETCDVVNDCQAGTPVSCDDGVNCTVDSCNESTGSCDNAPNDAACDNGLFCDGVETCDLTLDCQPGTGPCPSSGTCDEDENVCVAPPAVCGNDVCESGEDCNSCPSDCIAGPAVAPGCGNGVCEPGMGEDCLSCPGDCRGKLKGNPSKQFCCGDGDGTNPIACSENDGTVCNSEGFQCSDNLAGFCCGDLVCEAGENNSTCSVDCPASPNCMLGQPGESCTLDEECCTGKCKGKPGSRTCQ